MILGASGRAAAFSAIRAGFEPKSITVIDLFADTDLSGPCSARRIERDAYPGGLVRLARQAPAGPWIYTGGLENHPGVIEQIAADRPLWGVGPASLQRVRTPASLLQVLRAAGLPALEVRENSAGLPRDGSWLVKPLRSAGGTGIRPLDGLGPDPAPGSEYLQRRAVGPSGSAVFLGTGGEKRSARMIGVTRQWVGHRDQRFGYLGSVGPVRVSEAVRKQLERTGEVLAEEFGLLGLFGVDFVLEDGRAWPTEVNPRYSASVEVLEWATGKALLAPHARAFGGVIEGPRPTGPPSNRGGPRRVGKLIVFAPCEGQVPEHLDWGSLGPGPDQIPGLADLPPPGSRFREGEPVLTLLDWGPNAGACRSRLARRLIRWRARLRTWGSRASKTNSEEPKS